MYGFARGDFEQKFEKSRIENRLNKSIKIKLIKSNKIIRRGVNVLKRIRHVLLEEISIREKLKVSVLGGRIWISFHSD